MRKHAIALLAAITLALSTLTLTPADATASVSRATLTARAKKLQFSVPLSTFVATRKKALAKHFVTAADRRFDWHSDGCSASYKGLSAPYMSLFRKGCTRHDFGYRNFGHRLSLGSNDAMKLRIDKRLLADLDQSCDAAGKGKTCHAVAYGYYLAVHKAGKAATAFYGDKCTAGRLCLWDDINYKDRRKEFTASNNDLNSVDFGDKTSSVNNASSVAWVLFDDHGYNDTRFCIRPHGKVADLHAYGFNDKTSSVMKLATASCANYPLMG